MAVFVPVEERTESTRMADGSESKNRPEEALEGRTGLLLDWVIRLGLYVEVRLKTGLRARWESDLEEEEKQEPTWLVCAASGSSVLLESTERG